MKQRLVAILFSTLLAIAFTWPLLLNLHSHLPLGTEPRATVPLFNLWTLRWNADRLLVGYADYWEAPIFYPTAGAFARSDPQPLTGLLFAPLHLLTGSQILAYNLVLLSVLGLNGFAAIWLFRRQNVPFVPALLLGALVVALPFASNELGVLQFTVFFPVFFALGFLAEFARTGGARPALSLGIWIAITFLMNSQYGMFLSLFLFLGALIFFRRGLLNWKAVLSGVGGLALAGALLLPTLPGQFQLARDYVRSERTVERNSAQSVDYLSLGSRAWGRDFAPWLRSEGGSGQRLYPGSGLLLLAGAGTLEAWRRDRRWALFCLAGGGGAFLLSLGLQLEVGDWRPYELLRDYLPGFSQLRSPFRFGAFVQLFLMGLAGYGLGRLWNWRRPAGAWLGVGIVLLGALEVLALPLRLYAFPSERVMDRPWIGWLAEQPPGAVAMLPFPPSGSARDYEPTVIGMLQGLEHGQPLLNGYTGFFPPGYQRLRVSVQAFPTEESIRLLREAGATYLVVDREYLETRGEADLEGWADLELLFRDEEALVYRLAPEP